MITDAYKGPLPVMDARELRTLNQPARPLGPEQDPHRLVRCKVVGGVDQTYGWMVAGAPVVLGQVVELPFVDAAAFQRIGRVQIL